MSLQRFSTRALEAREREWRSGSARELREFDARRRARGDRAVLALATPTVSTLERVR
jgi:hypothetical protein